MNITYEDIRKANEIIKPMKISRKDKQSGKVITKNYAEVNQRIKAFRMVYPSGKILPELVTENDGIITFKATAEDGNGNILAVAHARENVKGSFINQTNVIENCETSAVGRVLGMCGFGVDTAIASAEEVQNAIKAEEQKNEIINEEEKIKLMADLEELIIATETSHEDIYDYFKIKSNTEMTPQQFKQAIAILKKKPIINQRKEEIF